MQCPVCQSNLPEGALFCGECGSAIATTEAIAQPAITHTPERAKVSEPGLILGDPKEPETVATQILEQVEEENLSDKYAPLPVHDSQPVHFAQQAELDSVISFTVSVATGESVELSRSALVGRMPQPDAGESFEHLIVITDPTRSVSKTHLELGVDNGQLWVVDRGSGNGSIIREPGVVPRRAQAGQRYDIVPGTRIDMGDSHLTIG